MNSPRDHLQITLLERDGGAPEAGLFFLLSPRRARDMGRAWEDTQTANGIAFLVDPSGLLVTAAHVITGMDLCIGDTVNVYSCLSNTALRAEAKILSHGWRGPIRNEHKQLPKEPGSPHLPDMREDVIMEDIAILQLAPESVRRDEQFRNFVTRSVDEMIAELRVLPIGAPGYASGENVTLKSWYVFKHRGAPTINPATAKFSNSTWARHKSFNVTSESIDHGFSGAPLWDEERQLAVGFVQSRTSDKNPARVRCTDARALKLHAGIPLHWDSEMEQAVQAIASHVENFAILRQPLAEQGRGIFVAPLVRNLVKLEASVFDVGRPSELPALQHIAAELEKFRAVCIVGGPGSGKSTLMQYMAASLLAGDIIMENGKRCVPLLFVASELPKELSLEMLFQLAFRSGAEGDRDESGLQRALRRNDAQAVLLIDGLDEVPKLTAAGLLKFCQGGGGATLNRIGGVVFSSRPDFQILNYLGRQSALRTPMRLVEVLPFEKEQVYEYVAQRLSDDSERAEDFRRALSQVDWQDSMTPLQLRFAAEIFRQDKLPARESDLTLHYIDFRISEATARRSNKEERATPKDGKPKKEGGFDFRKAKTLLQAVAFATRLNGSVAVGQVAQKWEPLLECETFKEAIFDRKASLDFIRRVLIHEMGLIRIENGSDGERLTWEHATIAELLAAEAYVERAANNPEAANVLLAKENPQGFDEQFTLALLTAMDRREWHDKVAAKVQAAVDEALHGVKENALAIRALAAGVKLPVALRATVVRLLVQMALLPKAGPRSCAEALSVSVGLPLPRVILQRIDLKEEIIAVMRSRLERRRPRGRVGERKRVPVMATEAELLTLLVLWNHWEEDGLFLAPDATADAAAAGNTGLPAPVKVAPHMPRGTMVLDRGGLEFEYADGTPARIEMPARSFLEGVVALTKSLPPGTPVSRVVWLYLQGITQASQPQTGGESGSEH